MKYLFTEGDSASFQEVTPELLAVLFAELNSEDQARFFNHLGEVATIWTAPFCFQLQAITDEHGLTYAGRRVMQEIGEYSHWGLSGSAIRRELERKQGTETPLDDLEDIDLPY